MSAAKFEMARLLQDEKSLITEVTSCHATTAISVPSAKQEHDRAYELVRREVDTVSRTPPVEFGSHSHRIRSIIQLYVVLQQQKLNSDVSHPQPGDNIT